MPIEMRKGLPFSVDTWSPNSKKKRHRFLTHAHKDHSQGILTHASFPIYCTLVTRTLVLNYYPQLDEGLFVGIEVGQTEVIHDPYGDFRVTAFDANHCPGAVMFLFEGSFGNILHTGDCRLSPECLQSLPEKYLKNPTGQLDCVFLDCTFGRSSLKMPSKQSAIQQVINCICEHPNAPRVYLASDLLGQEDILVDVSKTFGSQIYVDKLKNPEYYQALEVIVPEILTQDSYSRFQLFDGFPRLCERAEAKIAEDYAKFLHHPLIIRPSTQWYACDKRPLEAENRRKGNCDQAVRDMSGVWHVCYSMHSSREELEWALLLLAPKLVVSTTPSCQAMELDYVKKHCFKTQSTSDEEDPSSPFKTAAKDHLKPSSQPIAQQTNLVMCLNLSPPSRKSSITLFGKARISAQDSVLKLGKEIPLKENDNSLQRKTKLASLPVVEVVKGECMKSFKEGEEEVQGETECKSMERRKRAYDSSVVRSSKNYDDSLRNFYRSMNVSVPQPLPSLVELMKMMADLRNIEDINEATKNWSCIIFVEEKLQPTQAINSPSKYQKYIFVDSKVEGVMFNRDIELMSKRLQLFRKYKITNAKVITIPKEFQKAGIEMQWVIDTKTTIVEIESEVGIVSVPYKYVDFNDLAHFIGKKNEYVDVLAVVLEALPVRRVIKNNNEGTAQRFFLLDENMKVVSLTLWNEFITEEGKEIVDDIKNHPVVIAHRVTVSCYEGISLNTGSKTILLVNPPIEDALQFKIWAEINHKAIDELVQTRNYDNYAPKMYNAEENITPISNILASKKIVWVKALLHFMILQQKFWYMACRKCFTSTSTPFGEQYTCNSCGEKQEASPRSKLDCELIDKSGTITAIMFGDMAEKTLEMSALETMNHGLENFDDHLSEVCKKFKDKQYIIEIQAPSKVKYGNSRQRYTILDYYEAPLTEPSQRVIGQSSNQITIPTDESDHFLAGRQIRKSLDKKFRLEGLSDGIDTSTTSEESSKKAKNT